MNLRQHLLRAGSTPRLRALRRAWVWLRFSTRGRRVLDFLRYAWHRFEADDGLRMAAGLSYASLLAMVPLLAIALAILSAFPAFEGAEQRVITTVFDDFLPQASAEIADRVVGFVENASRLTGPGILALAATAILLLSNINGAFNTIWRVTEPRPTALSVLVYWALLTLGPLILGASISLSSYAFGMVRATGFESWTGGDVVATRVLSVGLAALGFGLLFYVVPNRRIRLAHALAGGLVSALLFELLKYGFALYLAHFPSYQAIYGAISSVPIFLIWLFLSWSVVLLGAEVTAGLPEWRAAQARGHVISGAGGRLALALAILGRLRQAARDGRQLKREQAIRGLPTAPAEVEEIVKPLREAGFLARTQTGRWLLGRDLETATLGELTDALGLSLEPGQGWPPAADAAVRSLARATEGQRTTPLERMLEAPEVREVA